MPNDPRLDALLDRWEDLRAQGQTPSAEELCSDCPELLTTLRWRIRALEAVDQMLGPADGTSGCTPPWPGPAEESTRQAPTTLSIRSNYRVLRFHAQGGLGEVLLARDEDLRREVALKRILPGGGPDSHRRERFLREAALTSRLEHPGIVPVYGLGDDGAGQPCYAMRFIRGETLQEAVRKLHQGGHEEDSLTLRQLLGRFVQVCNAVAYAHSKGVIHRDIKPANILLGSFGEALVVDWGLAKEGKDEGGRMKDEEKTECCSDSSFILHPSSLTLAGAVLGTPAYMSPEQAAGDSGQVGPSSDIFSLGATLCTLLTGQSPLARAGGGARARQGDIPNPRQLNKDVSPALEAICLKAMAPRPADRYATVLDLAGDVEHWLADEPVSVFRDPWRVRMGRWVRRHQTMVASAAALLITTVVALAVGMVVVGKAQAETVLALKQARDNETEARANFRMARESVDRFCTRVSEERLLNEPGMKGLRKELLEDAQTFYGRLVRQPSSDTEVRNEQGRAHLRLGIISAMISSRDDAIIQCEQARHVFEELARAEPESSSHRSQLVNTLLQLCVSYRETGRRDQTERAGREAAQMSRALLRDEPNETEYRHQLAESLYQLGLLFDLQGRRKEADSSFREALDHQEQLSEAEPNNPRWKVQVATTWNQVGTLHHSAGELDKAESAWRKSLGAWDGLVSAQPSNPRYLKGLAQAWNNVGVVSRLQGKRERTEEAWRKALALRQRLAGDHPSASLYQNGVASSLSNLGVFYYESGRYDEAEKAYRAALVVQEKLAGNFPSVVSYQELPASTWNNLGVLEKARGRVKPAEAAYRESLVVYERLAKAHPDVLDFVYAVGSAYHNLGQLMAGAGRPKEAVEWFVRAREPLQKVLKKDAQHADARRTLINLFSDQARALAAQGLYAEAVAEWDRAIGLSPEKHRLFPRVGRADALAHSGDHRKAAAEAEALTTEASTTGAVLYELACVFALCHTAVSKDESVPTSERPALLEKYAARAVGLLSRSHEKGFLRKRDDVEHMRQDSDLKPLRTRDDYRKVVAEIEGKGEKRP